MLSVLIHIYQHAEIYTVLLALIVLPLGYWECFYFLRVHYGMFQTSDSIVETKKEEDHAAH